ncbi:metallophosphoesterase [Neptuniibacter halophilus]|uniref:metallophosphoesterase n=1 Tax=Neptuniibacter halophilus TaxID=651666 RepID=UPI0025725AFE|nr:metallophosphoesterase [Neptuniibacter halophilus]
MAEPVLSLLQISDLHLQQAPEKLLHQEQPEARLRSVLEQIRSESADWLLLTGDLSHHAPAAYDRLSDYLQTLPYPARWIPGNHDLPAEMFRFAGLGYGEKVIEQNGWKIVLLDSTASPDGQGAGSLSEPELEFLATELAQSDPEQHLLLVLHHNPVSVNSVWQDRIGLQNSDQFWSVVECYPQVRGVVFGHVHQAWQLQRGSVRLFSVPATAAQFKAGCESPEIETDTTLAGPAYARYQLLADGEIQVRVNRLAVD